jgi:hypothetical protein
MFDDMLRHRSVIGLSSVCHRSVIGPLTVDDMVSDIGHDMPNDLLQLVAGG